MGFLRTIQFFADKSFLPDFKLLLGITFIMSLGAHSAAQEDYEEAMRIFLSRQPEMDLPRTGREVNDFTVSDRIMRAVRAGYRFFTVEEMIPKIQFNPNARDFLEIEQEHIDDVTTPSRTTRQGFVAYEFNERDGMIDIELVGELPGTADTFSKYVVFKTSVDPTMIRDEKAYRLEDENIRLFFYLQSGERLEMPRGLTFTKFLEKYNFRLVCANRATDSSCSELLLIIKVGLLYAPPEESLRLGYAVTFGFYPMILERDTVQSRYVLVDPDPSEADSLQTVSELEDWLF